MAVKAYIRISYLRAGKKASESMSLEAQRYDIIAFAERTDQPIDEWYIEPDVSGTLKLAERPEGAKLLASIKPGDVVIGAKLDRVFRNAADACQTRDDLIEQGVALHLLNVSQDDLCLPVYTLIYVVMSGQAQWESEQIGARVAKVRVTQRVRGEYLGGRVPFGYAKVVRGHVIVDGREKALYRLDPVPAQQAAIRVARDLQASGLSIRAVRTRLMEDHGVQLSEGGVANILSAS